MPTLNSLLIAAKKSADKRLELLVLLSALAGLLTSIFYRPAVDVVNAIMATLSASNAAETEYKEAITILTDNLRTIIFGQVALIAIAGFLLPLWARASAPGDLIPNQGGIPAFLSRGFRAFKYQLAATGLTIASFAIVAPITAVLSQILGSLALAAGGILILWLSFAWSATANAAIMLSVNDQPITFRSAWSYTRIFIRPLAGAYAALWLIAGIVNLLLSNLATQSLSMDIATPLTLVISGALTYCATALHLSSLFVLPETLDRTH